MDATTIWKNLDDAIPEQNAYVLLLIRAGITPGLSGIASGKWGTIECFRHNVAAWCYADDFVATLPDWITWEP